MDKLQNEVATTQAAQNRSARETVLDVQGLRVHYETPRGDVIAVNGVSFKIYAGETLGLVAVLRLVQPPGRIVEGKALLQGTDLVALTERELREVRWSKLALIPQGAMNSLNPVMRIYKQIADGIETHEGKQPRAELRERIMELLDGVGLPGRV